MAIKANAPGDDDEDQTLNSETLNSPNKSNQPSSYKGRDGEVDLNHCFEELEQIVIDVKEK